MAASASMQSVILPLSVTYGATKTNKSVTVSRLVAPTLLSYPHMMRVSSTAKDGQKEQPSTVTKASKIPPPPLTSSSSPTKASTKFRDLFAFSGPVPERTNGRLAMVGFVSALVVELYRGQDVFSQISNGGVSSFVAISILLSVASLIPLLKGVSVESKSDGIMTPDAELWNGRMAMLGLVALAFTEYMTGTTLV